MTFADRDDAGRRLAAVVGERLRELAPTGQDRVVVLGLPRGGVPVAARVAEALGAPLDVILVRKLGVPWQPELAAGAIGEDDVRVENDDVVRAAGLTPADLDRVELRERGELQRRIDQYRIVRPRVPLDGRVAVVVDDGLATGATARAACAVARSHGAARVVLAVPVAPQGWEDHFGDVADALVAVETPTRFAAVGQWYRDFRAVEDAEVLSLLAGAAHADPPAAREVTIPSGTVELSGTLTVPAGATAAVVFAHGSGSSRHSPRNRFVAEVLQRAGLATLLFDLLTVDEERDRRNVFDVGLLSERLLGVTSWLHEELQPEGLGYFGASTGAAAALVAAARSPDAVHAVVSRGGRPDLAGIHLSQVRCPTLLIVGSRDVAVLDLNESAAAQIHLVEIAVVPGATHLFEEPGTLQRAAELARDWFLMHLPDGSDG